MPYAKKSVLPNISKDLSGIYRTLNDLEIKRNRVEDFLLTNNRVIDSY